MVFVVVDAGIGAPQELVNVLTLELAVDGAPLLWETTELDTVPMMWGAMLWIVWKGNWALLVGLKLVDARTFNDLLMLELKLLVLRFGVFKLRVVVPELDVR